MRLALSLIATVCSTVAMSADSVPFSFTERPGGYAVGLRVIEQYDESRVYRELTDELGKPYSGKRSRPLQTLIWYPADGHGARSMSVGDYTELWATETTFGKPRMTTRAQEWIAGMKPALASPMRAVRDSKEAPGRFPVVIYAPSYSMVAWENADLCENLASHGYVVLASPSIGAKTREMTSDLAGVNAQADDISFLIGYAQTLANADATEVAVAGFSWGGLSNLFAATHDNRIDALIALDGSIRYWSGLVDEAEIDPKQMSIPLLYFAQGEYTLEDAARYLPRNDGVNVLNAWIHGDLVIVRMLGLTHAEFSSMYQRNEEIWEEFPQSQKADYGREHGIPGYAWVARYALQFLNAYLKHDPLARAYLAKNPAENGVPPHFMSVHYRAAQSAPASLESFRSQIGRQGFKHLAEVYAAFRQQEPDFKLDEIAMNSWAEELIDSDRLAEAVVLLELAVHMHPDSSNALANLGRAYEKSGLKRSAIESYRRTLEKNPTNTAIRRKLERLEE